MQPLVLQLQADAIDANVSASNLLRKAKIVATKLELPEFLAWINNELNGYENLDSLPPYRKMMGNPRALNPYRGWQPILSSTAEHDELLSSSFLGQAVGEIEEMLARQTEGASFTMSYPPKLKIHIIESLQFISDAKLEVSRDQVWGIIEAVRNTILNWSLELEKSGVLGEGLTFSENEKRHAAPVSHQFFATNIGVVGNVSDHGQVVSVQAAHAQVIDYGKLTEFVQQIKIAAPAVPENTRDALVKAADELGQELSKSDRDRSRIQRLLATIKTICEGAVGNVVAQGILSVIGSVS
jgi:hypothetical protein